jgi:hypothetical protein
MLKGRRSSLRACSGSPLNGSSHQALPCLIVFLATLPKVEPGADFARGIAYGVEIPLDALTPGRYILQLVVTDRAAQANASAQTLFIVE